MKEVWKYFGIQCGPCTAVAPIIKRVCTELSIPVVSIDVDMDPETAKRYGVKSIPTLILMIDGQPTKRLVGNFPEQKLRDFLS